MYGFFWKPSNKWAWPKSLLSTLIHVVEILDECVGVIPSLSAISSLSKPNRSRINVGKILLLFSQPQSIIILSFEQFSVVTINVC